MWKNVYDVFIVCVYIPEKQEYVVNKNRINFPEAILTHYFLPSVYISDYAVRIHLILDCHPNINSFLSCLSRRFSVSFFGERFLGANCYFHLTGRILSLRRRVASSARNGNYLYYCCMWDTQNFVCEFFFFDRLRSSPSRCEVFNFSHREWQHLCHNVARQDLLSSQVYFQISPRISAVHFIDSDILVQMKGVILGAMNIIHPVRTVLILYTIDTKGQYNTMGRWIILPSQKYVLRVRV